MRYVENADTIRVMNKLVIRAMPYSKSSARRLAATWSACKAVDRRKIEGAFVECGVWRGGNVMVARWASPSRQCWLYDTFAGMTEPGPYDIKRDGEKAIERYQAKQNGGTRWAECSVEDVRSNLKKWQVFDEELCKFVVGDVCKTLRVPANIPDRIAVLRLDTDWYESTKVELEVLYPRLVAGGLLLVDDYGHWLGARKAVDDYLGKPNKLRMIDYTGAWMVKGDK